MSDDHRLICLGLVPRKSLGVQHYSIALLIPNPARKPSDERPITR